MVIKRILPFSNEHPRSRCPSTPTVPVRSLAGSWCGWP